MVLDARRGEIYGAVYDDAGRLVTAEVVAKLAPWLASLPAGVEEFLSNDLSARAGRHAIRRRASGDRAARAGGAIARIAAERLARGEACDPAAWTPTTSAAPTPSCR